MVVGLLKGRCVGLGFVTRVGLVGIVSKLDGLCVVFFDGNTVPGVSNTVDSILFK